MTAQQQIDYELYNRDIRLIERRREVKQRLEALVKRPTDTWTLKDRTEIRMLIQRLIILSS